MVDGGVGRQAVLKVTSKSRPSFIVDPGAVQHDEEHSDRRRAVKLQYKSLAGNVMAWSVRP